MTKRVVTDRGAIGSSAEGGNSAGDPICRVTDELDQKLRNWLDRCRELAESNLDGIEDPARELAELAAADRRLMERAYRLMRQALEHEPRNSTLQQMLLFWRRAFEKGTWSWEDVPPDPNRYLS